MDNFTVVHERDDYRRALQEIADSNYCDYGDTAHQDIARAALAKHQGGAVDVQPPSERARAVKAEAQLDESRYASAANRADAAGARCIELEKENDRLRTALAQAEAENERLTRELDEANASIDAQREEITRMVKECDGLRAKLRVAKTKGEEVEKLSSLRMKVNVLLSEIGESQDRLLIEHRLFESLHALREEVAR